MGKENDNRYNRISRFNTFHGHNAITKPILKGCFVAAPVCGLGYRTATQKGVTNRDGEFRYLQGERVTFYIGKTNLPSASTGPTVTPYDVGRSPNEAINTTRLLQSLAGLSNNLLTIPTAVALWATGAIDFSLDPNDFAQQLAVVALIERLGCTLIDTKTAIERLDSMIARYFLRK